MEQVLYPIPGKYNLNDPVDVSVIIPLYNSRNVVKDQILRWVSDYDLKVEIIYVDDKCPKQSKNAVYESWNKRRDKHQYLVKLVCSHVNRGYGGANNLGAHFAKGKYLIFLNSDTVVTPNWIKPMIDVLEDESVGIVGNLQLKEGGQWHGTIDSAGSEWSWDHMNFMHIGRHIYYGKLLKRPIDINKCPPKILQLEEREMVTGCCFGIRKELYQRIGGFNLNYRVGYWEDSEICLTVRSLGYKIMFQPNSVIYHKLHHSESGGHDFHDFNKQYFFNKWVDTGEIDKYVGAKRQLKQTKVSKILVQRKGANGDVLVATSILPGLREKYPDAKIDFHTVCPKVLIDNPYIDEVVSKTRADATSYHLRYNLDYAYERMPLVNIRESYGIESNIEPQDPFIGYSAVEGLPDDPYVVIHAGKTAWVGRNWSGGVEFIPLSSMIEKQLGYKIVWVGVEGDNGLHGPYDFRGKTDFQQLATIMKNAALFVGIDSFPFHVAQAVNTPGVTFFGSILPETRIYRENMNAVTAESLKCLGCHHRKVAPATVTDECETGTLECETMVTLSKFYGKVKEKLCSLNV